MEFLNIGGGELLIIALLALILFGPEDVVNMMRSLGKYTRGARQMWQEFSRQVQEEYVSAKELEDALAETQASVAEAQQALAEIETSVKESTTAVQRDVAAAQRSLKSQADRSAAALRTAKAAPPAALKAPPATGEPAVPAEVAETRAQQAMTAPPQTGVGQTVPPQTEVGASQTKPPQTVPPQTEVGASQTKPPQTVPPQTEVGASQTKPTPAEAAAEPAPAPVAPGPPVPRRIGSPRQITPAMRRRLRAQARRLATARPPLPQSDAVAALPDPGLGRPAPVASKLALLAELDYLTPPAPVVAAPALETFATPLLASLVPVTSLPDPGLGRPAPVASKLALLAELDYLAPPAPVIAARALETFATPLLASLVPVASLPDPGLGRPAPVASKLALLAELDYLAPPAPVVAAPDAAKTPTLLLAAMVPVAALPDPALASQPVGRSVGEQRADREAANVTVEDPATQEAVAAVPAGQGGSADGRE